MVTLLQYSDPVACIEDNTLAFLDSQYLMPDLEGFYHFPLILKIANQNEFFVFLLLNKRKIIYPLNNSPWLLETRLIHFPMFPILQKKISAN